MHHLDGISEYCFGFGLNCWLVRCFLALVLPLACRGSLDWAWFPLQIGMETQVPNLRTFKFKELRKFTENFRRANYIGQFQFEKVYRGKIGEKDVTVKIWRSNKHYWTFSDERKKKMDDEILLLAYESLKTHPNLVKVLGFCYQGDNRVGIVYDLDPLDMVHHLILGDDFDWKSRLKVAIGLARALECVHKANVQDPFYVRNLSPHHVICDKDYNPKLYEFGMISGGNFPNRDKPRFYAPGCLGYADPYATSRGCTTLKADVFAYGVILLSLISKRVFEPDKKFDFDDVVHMWANKKHYRLKKMFPWRKISFVADCLKGRFYYPNDGLILTELGLKCVAFDIKNRPTMSQVLDTLMSLQVVKEDAPFMGVEGQLSRDGNDVASCQDSASAPELGFLMSRMCWT